MMKQDNDIMNSNKAQHHSLPLYQFPSVPISPHPSPTLTSSPLPPSLPSPSHPHFLPPPWLPSISPPSLPPLHAPSIPHHHSSLPHPTITPTPLHHSLPSFGFYFWVLITFILVYVVKKQVTICHSVIKNVEAVMITTE